MSQKWTKVKNLKVGSQIAVYDNGVLAWDEVVSIKSVSRERVYDIEVENSHNFVANSILAHNTYIFGNLEVAGDIAGQAFINISTAAAKKDINFLSDADYEDILGKIASTSVASYYYNSESECGGENPPQPSLKGGSDTPPLGGVRGDLICAARLGLIAEQAPREILSVDGKGVDLYKMSSFLWAGVKAQQKKIEDIAQEVALIKETIGMSLGSEGEIPMSGEGTEGTVQPSALMAAVSDIFNQMGLAFDQGVMKIRDLAVDFLQVRKLAVDVTPDDVSASGPRRDPTIGSSQINPGETAIYIVNNQVSTSSKIFITAERPVALGLCLKNQATSTVDGLIQPPGFKVCLNQPAGETIKFDWWIIDAIDNSQQPTSPPASAEASAGEQPSPNTPSLNLPLSQGGEGEGVQGEGAGEVSPSPKPSALPSPSPSVSPEPEPTPSIEPTPSAEPTSPQPSPYQGEGEGGVSPSPSPSPEPSPSETPAPSPSPSPSPSPEPSPTP